MHRSEHGSASKMLKPIKGRHGWTTETVKAALIRTRNDGPTSKSLIRSRWKRESAPIGVTSIPAPLSIQRARKWPTIRPLPCCCRIRSSARPTWSTEKPPSPKLPECKRLLRHWPAKRPKYRHENARVRDKKRILRWSQAVVAPNPLLRNPSD